MNMEYNNSKYKCNNRACALIVNAPDRMVLFYKEMSKMVNVCPKCKSTVNKVKCQ